MKPLQLISPMCRILLSLILFVCGFTTSFAQPYLYFGASGNTVVQRVGTNGTGYVNNLVTGGSSTRSAHAEQSTNFLYWGNDGNGTIGRSNLDGTGANHNFMTGVVSARDIYVAGNYIYWVLGSTIGRANINGTGINTNFITGCNNSFGLAVDIVNGYIFWTNYGGGTIGRANIDGTGVNQSFITTGANPFAIDTDPTNGKVYWIHYNGASSIGVANVDGTGVNNSLVTGQASAPGIAVDAANNTIYWNVGTSIGKCALNGTGVNATYITGLLANSSYLSLLTNNPPPPAPTVTSFTPMNAAPGQTVTINGTNFTGTTQVQFGGTNAASFNVVSATQITAVVNAGASGSVDVTAPGGTGSMAGFTYNAPTVTTLYAARTGGQIGTVRTDGTMQNLAAATGIGFGRDVFRLGSYIYWCDETGNRIGRANADGSSPNVNFITGCSAPNGLYVTATNIYWTNYSGTTLGRANIDGTGVNQSFCATGLSQPVGIAVDVVGGFIYWSRTNFGTIGRVALDGVTGLNASFMTGLTNPGGMWIDNPNNYLYFTQGGASNTVQRAQLSSGTGVTPLVAGCNAPVGITSDGTFLFWSNQGTGNIGRSLMTGAGATQTFSTGFTNLRGIGIGPNPAPGPTITTVLPASAQAGATITINGSNFTGATSVMLGNQSVAFTPVSASQITFTLPVLGGGGFISVVTSNGSAQSATGLGFDGTFVVGQPNFVSAGAAVTSTGLNFPEGVAVDVARGKLYVADRNNHRVVRYAWPVVGNSPVAQMVFGQPNLTSAVANNGGLSASSLNVPIDVVVDPATGDLWVSEFGNNRILRFAAAHTFNINQPAATQVLGQASFTANAAATTQTGLNGVHGLSLDASGRLWVADMQNNRVLRFDNAASLGNGANASAVLGQAVFTSNAMSLTQNGMNNPHDVALDAAGNLFVSDLAANRILRFNNAAAKANGANADGVLGQTLFTTSVAAATATGMNGALGLAVSPAGDLFVCDRLNRRVLVFNNAAAKANGAVADRVLGQTTFITNAAATTQSGMNEPRFATFVSGDNVLLTSDFGNNRVILYGTPTPQAAPTVTSFLPTSAAPGASVVITGTNFNNASVVQFGGTNALSFVVNSPTQITAVVNDGANGNVSVTTPGGTGSQAGFTYTGPPVQTLYAARSSGQIGTVRTDGTMQNFAITTGVGFGRDVFRSGAYIYWANETGNAIGRANADGSSANFNFITGCNAPNGVCVTATHIYWTNYGSTTIGRANIDGSGVNQSFCNTGLSSPISITIDGVAGQIYWSCAVSGTIGKVALDGVTGLNGSFITGLSSPGGVWTDNANNFIYWTESASNTIRRAQLSTGTGVTTLVTGCSTPVGITSDGSFLYWSNQGTNNIGCSLMSGVGANQTFSTGFTNLRGIGIGPNPAPGPTITSFTPPTAQAGATITINGTNLAGPTSVMLGNQAVTFTPVSASQITFTVPVLGGGGLISLVTPNGSAQSATGFGFNGTFVVGQPNFTSSGAATTSTGLNFPEGVTVDVARGKLYVADRLNNRILRFAYPITANNPTAQIVFGQPNFTSSAVNNGGLSASSLNLPTDILVDPSNGDLWVSDYFNNRVLRFAAAHAIAANQPTATQVLGQPNFTSNGAAATQNGMNQPHGLALESSGRLWVADFLNNRTLRFDNAASLGNGANASGVLGQVNFTANAASVSQSGLNTPISLAIDAAGNLYIADVNAHRILRFNNAASKPNGANADGVLGQTLFTTNGAAVSATAMNFPGGLAISPAGDLFVNDRNNNRILAFNNALAKANGAAADRVLGQTTFTTNGAATTQTGMNLGQFLTFVPGDNVLLSSEWNNNRVVVYGTPAPPPAPTITSFTPTAIAAGGTVVITGTNLNNTSVVQFGGTNAASFVVDSPTQITAVVGAGATGNVTVTTPGGTANLAGFTLGIAPTAFSAQTPPTGALGLPYSYIFTANGIPAPTYALQSGTLPTGLTLNASTGELSGTPSATGTFGPVTIRATNVIGTFDTAPFSITINTPPTAFTAQTPPAGTSGSAYSYTFTANGSPAPTYSLFAGTLPPGLTLNTSTGALSGTPTSGGTYSGIVIRASNVAGAFNSNSISITINGAPTSFTAAPANGVVGTPYSYFFTANGFPAPSYALFSGVLPTGLSLNTSTGELSGTPTAAGTFGVTVIRASNIAGSLNSNSFNITIAAAPSSPTTFSAQTPANGSVNAAYSYTFVANGFPSPTYSLFAGTLPTGLSLDAATGLLTGTPTVSGTFGPITIQASNGSGTLNSTPFSITVNGAPTNFSAQMPGNGVVGTPYNYAFAVNGLPAPTYSIVSGTLPTGLSLSGAGVISGTPSVAATFGPIIVQASNGAGSVNTMAFNITIAATGTAPTMFTAQSPPSGLVGSSYAYTFAANGAPAPSFAVNSGTLPAGLTLTAANGLLSGVPTAAGVFGPITLAATNGFGSTTSVPFTITVNQAPSSFIAQTPPNGAVGTAYSYALVANGYPAPAYSLVSGTLPAGLTLSGAGVISGTPSASGVFTGIVVKAQNAFGNVNTVSMSISISAAAVAPTAFTAQTPPNGNQTVPYSYTFAANGSPSPTYTVIAGTLPTGLSLNAATGVLSGTPTTAGGFGPITVQAMNGAGSFNSTSFNITIQQAPPTIANFTPTGSIAGATITINGTNLTGVSAVSFGGVAAASFTPVSATQVTAVVAAGGATGNVSLTTPGGTVSLGVYSFFAAPTITTFAPSATAQGSVVTITGTNFTGATQVQFGGVNAASFSVISPTQINAVVPMGAPNAVLSVTTPGGTAMSGTAFTLLAAANDFYYQSGPADNPANWNTLSAGGGLTAGSFLTSGQNFFVPTGRTAMFNVSTSIGAGVVMQVENGAAIVVPNGQTLTALGIMRVNAGGRLRLEGTGAVVSPSAVQFLGTTAVLEYANSANRLTTNNEFNQVFNAALKLDNANIRLNETKSVTGAFTAENASTLALGAGNALTLQNALTMTGGSHFSTDSSNSLLIAGGGAITGDVNFAASGGGTPVIARLTLQRPNTTVRLAGSLRVSTTLTLQGGFLELQPNMTLSLSNPQDTALNGGSSGAYIRGAFARAMFPNLNGANVVTPQYRFPVGKGSTYLPAVVVAATTGTASPLVSLEAFDTGSGGSVASGSAGSVSPSEHWKMNILAGDLTQHRIGLTRDSIPNTASVGASATKAGAYTSVGGTKETVAGGARLLSSALTAQAERFYSFIEILPTTPAITGFSPTTGTTGTLLTVQGRNFTGATSVRVGGVAVESFTVVNSTTVTAVLGNVASGAVTITAPGGSATTTANLTFIPPVGGGSMSGGGSSGGGGGTGSGGTGGGGNGSVGLGGGITGGSGGGGGNGSGPPGGPIFLGPGSPLVLTGLTPQQLIGLTIGGLPATFTFLPDGRIIVNIPPGATTGTLVITTPNGTITSTDAFAIAEKPANLNITPAVASTGEVITLTGSGFEGVQSVTVGGANATYTVNSSEQISMIIPQGTTRMAEVVVNSAGGSVSGTFEYAMQPSGGAGGTAIARVSLTGALDKNVTGGATVRVTGANLEFITTVRLRTILGATMATWTVISPREIVVTVPQSGLLATTSGTRTEAAVTIEVVGGNNPMNTATLDNAFTVLLLPEVQTISRFTASIGETITLTGVNLQLVAEIRIGEARAEFRREGAGTILIVTVPGTSGVPAAGALTLLGANNSFSQSIAIINAAIVAGLPIPLGFTPTSGSAGTEIRVTGANMSVVAGIEVNGIALNSFRVVNPSDIRGSLSMIPSATRFGTVRLLTATGATITLPGRFEFTESLEADSVEVASLIALAGGRPMLNWNAQTPIRSWAGVVVDSNRVRSITLRGVGLSGVIPQGLGRLARLQSLDLSGNNLTGGIPTSFTALSQLSSLNLAANRLNERTTLTQLCSLKALRTADLSNNLLDGEISICLVTSLNLQRLNLSNNRFSGRLPWELAASNLEELRLAGNLLSGELSKEFGTIGNDGIKVTARTQQTQTLKVLDVSNNRLSGRIPVEWAKMSAIEELNLAGNRLEWVVPQDLSAWRNIQVLRLENNQFEGIIPANLPTALLREVNLANNRFTGSLPQAFTESARLRILNIANNRFTGMPTLTGIGRLDTIRAEGNRLQFGAIEPNVSMKNFSYIPQDSLGRGFDTVIVLSRNLTLTAGATGTQNRYEWLKNGRLLTTTTANADVLSLRDISRQDEGVYVCRITSARVPNLVLTTRAVTVRATAPTITLTPPILTFPPQAAQNVGITTRLQWRRVEGAEEYNVMIARDSSLRDILLRRSVLQPVLGMMTGIDSVSVTTDITNLERGFTYYWRVQALNANVNPASVNTWSPVSRFTTVPVGRELAFTTLDVGKAIIGEESIARGVLMNVSENPITLERIQITAGDQVFDIDSVRGKVLQPREEIPVAIRFVPKEEGIVRATINVSYQDFMRVARNITFEEALRARGTPLKALVVDFDTVRVGKRSLGSMLIVNRGTKDVKILQARVIPPLGEESDTTYTVQGVNDLVLAPQDTAFALIRCFPRSAGAKQARIEILAEQDTTFAEVGAIARFPMPDDAVAVFGLRAFPDSVAPGGAVMLELYLDEKLSSLPMKILRVAQPLFQGSVRFGSQVLALDASERTVRALKRGSAASARGPVTAIIPQTSWDGRSYSLLRFQARAVAGETDRDLLQIEDIKWGVPGRKPEPWESKVFVEDPITNSFTAVACAAGGKRLVTTAKATAIMAVSPNPVKNGIGELSYSVREDGNVVIEFINVGTGAVAKRIVDGDHTPGEYMISFGTQDLPSGAYVVRLQAANALVFKRVDVVR